MRKSEIGNEHIEVNYYCKKCKPYTIQKIEVNFPNFFKQNLLGVHYNNIRQLFLCSFFLTGHRVTSCRVFVVTFSAHNFCVYIQ